MTGIFNKYLCLVFVKLGGIFELSTFVVPLAYNRLLTLNTDLVEQLSCAHLDMIADRLSTDGYLLLPNALPKSLLSALQQRVQSLAPENWRSAGVGRAQQYQVNQQIRSDKIHWINATNEAEAIFLSLMDQLRQGLNQRLYMGLFDYESHFSIYQSGDFYQKHIDALKGRSNRVLSTVLYLNTDWQAADAGELLLYAQDGEQILAKVAPNYGTLLIFLSEQFPHQVLAANRDRYSIAGWFRVNNNRSGIVDPTR